MMGTITILPETTKTPITLIGSRAGICWGADISDQEKNYKRGRDCIESNHGRTLEFPDVHMVLDGYSAGVIREWYTHVGGLPTRLQASTRYIKYANFPYVTPPSIAKNQAARDMYDEAMATIAKTKKALEDMGIPKEDARDLLPLGMETLAVCKHNLRNLIDMSRQRMCQRAYWEYRQLFNDLLYALSDYSAEWMTLVATQFRPKCEVLGYCPETRGCGKYPKREG